MDKKPCTMILLTFLLCACGPANTPASNQTPNPTIATETSIPLVGRTVVISVDQDGNWANDWCSLPEISGNGRYVAFGSSATNLVTGDTNGQQDIFVRDNDTGMISLISVASDGTQGNGTCDNPSISRDGSFIAFWSEASNLVSGDTNGQSDVFLHELSTGKTTRISVASDRSQANGASYNEISLSADGKFVAFRSSASNLVAGDTNDEQDVFVYAIDTRVTTRVSVASDGTQGNGHSWISDQSISSDGRYIAFASGADNLVPGDTNNIGDIFVHDRETGITSRVSISSNGTQSNNGSGSPSISGDGRYVAFESGATNLVPNDSNNMRDIFVHDRETGTTSLVSVSSDGTQGNESSHRCSISEDGRFVAFSSDAGNLVPGDPIDPHWRYADVFVHELRTGSTTQASVASDGAPGNMPSYVFSISDDGRYIVFTSWSNNLVPGDLNDSQDIFMRDREYGQ